MSPIRAALFVFLAGCARTAPGSGQPSQQDTDDSGEGTDAPTRIRVATWNVESLGAADSEEHEAVVTVLARIDADIVGLNEIDELENPVVEEIAASLGYDVVVPDDNPFGDLHNAVLSRLPIVEHTIWESDALSGDASANDATRLPVSVTVNAGPAYVTVVAQHWKSGFEDIDEFRRSVDSIRTAQAAALAPGEYVLVVGDVNHEIDDGPESPDPLTSIPAGAPSSYWLGSDLYDQMTSEGIRNDPFVALDDVGLVTLDAEQADGRVSTRDESGRRIDYIAVNALTLEALEATLVYDSRDDDMVTMTLAGDPPTRETSAAASDHFPVLAELVIP